MPTNYVKKPREFILSAAKDGVVGVRVFHDVLSGMLPMNYLRGKPREIRPDKIERSSAPKSALMLCRTSKEICRL